VEDGRDCGTVNASACSDAFQTTNIVRRNALTGTLYLLLLLLLLLPLLVMSLLLIDTDRNRCRDGGDGDDRGEDVGEGEVISIIFCSMRDYCYCDDVDADRLIILSCLLLSLVGF
jgi:hypothetical protein